MAIASDGGPEVQAACLTPYRNATNLVARTTNTIVNRRLFVEEISCVQALGYAVDKEESSPGVVCLGLGICDDTPETAIAISITGPSSWF